MQIPTPPEFRLGVLGGMGPLATADFLRKLILATPARCDQDHVPTIIWNLPQIADRQHAIAGTGPSPLPQLSAAVRLLNTAGATLIVIPCNTVHHWHAALQANSQTEILHIADTTIAALNAVRGERIGLVATAGALRTRLYQDRLARHGMTVLENSAEEMAQLFIPGCAAIKRNALDEGAALLEAAASALVARGAQRLVLACTEVPLALAHCRSELLAHSVDPSQALAEAAVQRWLTVRRDSNSRPNFIWRADTV